MSFAERLFGAVSKHLPNGVNQGITASYFKANACLKHGLRGTHSAQSLIRPSDKMRVKILPALSDNYMYLLVDEETNEAAVVDPVAPDVVAQAVKDEGVSLTTILTTHHHWDHAGGNLKMVEMVKDIKAVYGGDDRIEGLTKKVGHGDKLKVGNLNIECHFTPCHTTGHICFFVNDSTSPSVFTGDTLFLAGCGRFFEGTPEQMHEALVGKLAKMPEQTRVFCGHEYSVSNLKYAAHVEPENELIRSKLAWCIEQRSKTPPEPTLPSTIGEEKSINPFMRVEEDAVQSHTKTPGDAVATMAAIRKEKDGFQPK